MAGAEGQAGLDLDGEVADAAAVAVMRAMDQEAAGAHRLQAFQRVRHPVDVGQDFALDRRPRRQAASGLACGPRRRRRRHRHRARLPGYRASSSTSQHGERQAVFLECGLERREERVGGLARRA